MNTVLVVDDNEINVDLLDAILADDYIVHKALGGIAAMEALEKELPDIILLDIDMPGMDGFEVIKKIKNDPRFQKIPVIFVTGVISADSESHGLELGAIDYITKPYNEAIVRSRVKNQMELAQYRMKLEDIVKERTHEVVAAEEAIVFSLALLAEKRDENTGTHLMRIKEFTQKIVTALTEIHPDMITHTQAHLIPLLSPVHDIGKIGVPDTILLKEGPLTSEEFEIMKKHTLYGSEVLHETSKHMGKSIEVIDMSIEIAENHHERYDGTGYPYGRKSDEIPISARIVSVADVYDALVSERPYKKAYSHDEAMKIITNGDGRTEPTHFDPRVLEAFVYSMNPDKNNC